MNHLSTLPVYEAKFVYTIDCKRRLSHIELRTLFTQGIFFHKEGHHVPARQELHDKVQVHGVLEAVVHFNHPLMIGFYKDITFSTYVGYLRGK